MQSKRFMTYEGDSFSRTLTLRTIDGDPYDLTGTKVWFVVKADPEDPDGSAALSLTWDNGVSAGITVADPTTGELVISRSASEMISAVDAGLYYWYLRVRDAAAVVRTLDAGLLDVLASPVGV